MSINLNCTSVSNAEKGKDVPTSEAHADFLLTMALPSRLRAARPTRMHISWLPPLFAALFTAFFRGSSSLLRYFLRSFVRLFLSLVVPPTERRD